MPYYMSGADSASGGRSAAESDEGTLAAKYGFWKLYLMSCVAEVLMILAILLFLLPIILDEPLLYLIPVVPGMVPGHGSQPWGWGHALDSRPPWRNKNTCCLFARHHQLGLVQF